MSDLCSDCGKDIIKGLCPPFSRRTGHGGQPMTRAEARHLFVEAHGGRCTDCYLKHRSAGDAAVARKSPVSPMFENLDLLRLRQLVARTYGVFAGTRETADKVNSMNREELLTQLQPT